MVLAQHRQRKIKIIFIFVAFVELVTTVSVSATHKINVMSRMHDKILFFRETADF